LTLVTALLFLPMRHTLFYEAVAVAENKPWKDHADSFGIRAGEHLYIFVARKGACSAPSIDAAVRSAVATE
jgi:hypothetical protein